MDQEIMVVTTNDIPRFEVVEVYGEVFGLIVRSRNIFGNVGASFRTVFGGEVKSYTKLLADTRQQAMDRLRDEAIAKGANAVLMMRFDSGNLAGQMNEVVAYGTAVKIRPQKKS